MKINRLKKDLPFAKKGECVEVIQDNTQYSYLRRGGLDCEIHNEILSEWIEEVEEHKFLGVPLLHREEIQYLILRNRELSEELKYYKVKDELTKVHSTMKGEPKSDKEPREFVLLFADKEQDEEECLFKTLAIPSGITNVEAYCDKWEADHSDRTPPIIKRIKVREVME